MPIECQAPISIFIPTLTAGGAERVASILANQWAKNHSVVVFTYFEEPHFYNLDSKIQVKCLGLRANRAVLHRAIDVIDALISFRRIVSQVCPSFVLSFMNKYNAFCLAALAGTKIPVIVSERDSPTEVLPRFRVLARDTFYPRAAGVICQTETGCQFIENRYRCIQRTIAIPNPVEPLIDTRTRSPNDTILNIGRLVPKKGHKDLLKAFAKMTIPGWRLVLCGDGPCRNALKSQAQALGIADRVEFAGSVQDLQLYFRHAGMFAFSSLYEGYPNALAEAMVSGLPCVSYDCLTGPSELIVHEKNGLLVPVGDIESLSAAMDRIADDPSLALRLGSAATDLTEKLAPASIAQQYLDFCLKAAAESAQ